MAENEPGMDVVKTRKVKTTSPGSGRKSGDDLPAGSLVPGEPGFRGLIPTRGEDLMAQWGLHPDAWTGARLKILVKKPMGGGEQLLKEGTVEEFSAEEIAREFGPGDYVVMISKDASSRWEMKRANLPVSPMYARNSGFAAVPATPARVSEMRSIQETAQAMGSGQGMRPEQLMQMLETIVDRAIERAAPRVSASGGMRDFENMLGLMEMIDRKTQAGIDRALMLAGMKPKTAEPEEPREESWGDIIKACLPSLASLAGEIMASRQASAPAPIRIMPPPPPPMRRQEPQPTAAMSAPTQEIDSMLTAEEKRTLSPALAMLSPFVGKLVQTIETATDMEECAAGMAEYIPPFLVDKLLMLADIADERGAQVLSIISPSLATEKGLSFIRSLRAFYASQFNEEDQQ